MEVFETGGTALVIERSSQIRSILSAFAKEVGFTNVSGVPTIGDAISLLETEEISWIICPIILADSVNTLQLLRLCLTLPEFRHTRVSAFYNEDQVYVLPIAFELGLFTCHPTANNKTAMIEAATILKQRIDQNGKDSCPISAEYLREILIARQEFSELLLFSEALMLQYPGHMGILLWHAEAQARSGHKTAAAATLAQIKLLDAGRAQQAEAIHSKLLPDIELPQAGGAGGANMLGITNAVVVDPDELSLNSVREILTALGAVNVEYFTCPVEAIAYLDGRAEQSLVIHEWRLPKVSGPIFLQRIRQLGHEKTPVIILSSLVSGKDQHLTREMGVAMVVQKPMLREEFLQALIWTLKQERHPTEVGVLERKMMAYLIRKNFLTAIDFKKTLVQGGRITEAVSSYFDAEIAYYQNHFEEAKAAGFAALKRGYSSVRLYNLIGRVLMKLGDFDAAIRCLEKAQELSPLNILRLCALADCNSELSRAAAGQEALDKAKALDPTNSAVQTHEAKFNLTIGDVKMAGRILQKLDNFDDVLSYLNNRGVSLSRAGKIDEAQSFYLRALEALPAKADEVRKLIHYNLSLSYARASDLPLALAQANLAKESPNKKLAEKAYSLAKRLDAAIKNGTPFSLLQNQQDCAAPIVLADNTVDAEKEADYQLLSTNPGEQCCHRVYSIINPDAALQELYQRLPPFKRRRAIERSETRGLDPNIRR